MDKTILIFDNVDQKLSFEGWLATYGWQEYISWLTERQLIDLAPRVLIIDEDKRENQEDD